MSKESAEIAAHRAAGRGFSAAGVESFALDAGSGPTVVCMHGVPVSSYLYRKLVPSLAAQGLRGVAFDFPGLGLAERPEQFDYSWTGLGRFSVAAIDALGINDFHLVIHDIGGPVGLEVAAALRDRVRSITVLNTLIAVSNFKKPWPMRPFELPGVGELWLASMIKPAFRVLMRMVGVHDMNAVPAAELDAHVDLLKLGDGGKAFLKIMRSFETTEAKQALYASTVRDVPYPVQVIWGEHDTALKLKDHGQQAQAITGVETIHRLPGKHFLQEDCNDALVEKIGAFVGAAD